MDRPKPTDRPVRRLTKTVSMDLDLVEAIEQRARDEGHGNFSRVMVSAALAYLSTAAPERQEDVA